MELYAMYLRRSRADIEKEQFGEFETLAKHEHELNELANARGYVVDEVYKELVSGEHISERAEFQRLLKEVTARKYKGILVHSISRLGRGNPMEYGYVLMIFQMSNTLIVTPTKVFDPNNEDDIRYLQMEMFISNMELGSIRARLNSGMQASAKAGCYIKPTPPYGYDRIKIDGNWTLTANDDAPIVRYIFERAAAGASRGTIATELNNKGILTQHGKLWSASRIYYILNNPHYMGKIRYGYYHRELVPTNDGFNLKAQNSTRDDYILVDGLHEGIVSAELWEQANEPRGNSAHVTRSKELKNPLAGLLVCAKCGRPMLRFINTCPSNGHKIEHLRHERFCDCHMRGARLSLVVDAVINALTDIVEDGTFNIPPDDHKNEIAALKTALTKETRKQEKLMQAFFANAITVNELKERRGQSEANAEKLREQLKNLENTPKPKDTAKSLRAAIRALKNDHISAQDKNDVLKMIIERIEYDNRTESISHPDIRLHIVIRQY